MEQINLRTITERNTPLMLAILSMIRNEELAQGIDSFISDTASNTDTYNLFMRTTNNIINDLLYLGNWLFVETASSSINSRNSSGQTVLQIAVKHDFLELASTLLERGADPDVEIQDEDGNTTTIRDMLNQKIGLI